jgi:hypothetical protein
MPEARTETGYWLVGVPETLARSEITEFRQWLQQELREFEELSPVKQRPAMPAAS